MSVMGWIPVSVFLVEVVKPAKSEKAHRVDPEVVKKPNENASDDDKHHQVIRWLVSIAHNASFLNTTIGPPHENDGLFWVGCGVRLDLHPLQCP
jgi:hypothetical protein